MTSRRKTLWALVLLCLSALLALRALSLAEGPTIVTSAGGAETESTVATLLPLEEVAPWRAPGYEDSFEILERPLFETTRRPPEEGGTEIVSAEEAEITLRSLEASLTGVIITDARRIIIIRDDRGEERRLEVGDEIGGWILDVIESEQAQLIDQNGEERRTLSLVYQTDALPENPRRTRSNDEDDDE